MLITASDIIRRSLALYRDNGKLCFTYLGLLTLPTIVQSLALSIIPLNQNLTTTTTVDATISTAVLSGPHMAIAIVLTVLFTILQLWFSFAFTRALAARYTNGQALPPSEELKSTVAILLPAIWVTILVGLVIVGGLVLLIIPGIIFAIWFAFGSYAMILDGRRGTAALKYSKQLVAGRWGEVFWRLLAPSFAFIIIMFVLQSILGAAYGAMMPDDSALTASGGYLVTVQSISLEILSALITLFFTPLLTAATTILYLELKKTPARSEAVSAPN